MAEQNYMRALDDEEEVEAGPALQPQPGDVDVGAGADQMAALELAKRSEETGTQITDPAALTEYKQKRELERKVDDAFARRKDYNRDGKKDNLWQRFKGWGSRAWNKGKDDPLTPEREDQTEEVTKFMGGMTRQELSMFLFEWGGLMMTNADEGFGGAMGAAGLGAMEGHRSRQAGALEAAGTEADRALKEREVAALEERNRVGNLKPFKGKDGTWRVPRWDNEQGRIVWEAASDAGGKIVPPGIDTDWSGEKTFLMDLFKSVGKTEAEIADFFMGKRSEAERRQDLNDALIKLQTGSEAYTDDPYIGKPFGEFDKDDKKAWIDHMLQVEGTIPSITDKYRD